MSKIIRAKVTTNSSEDSLARVKVKAEGAWTESPLIESVGGIPLKKDDVVYVDVSDGFEAPLIVGRSFDESVSFKKPVSGSLLFESASGSEWSICFVKNKKFEFYNSDNTSIVVDGQNIIINGGNLGGLIKIEKLLEKLNSFIEHFNNHGHSISGTAGTYPFQQATCTGPVTASLVFPGPAPSEEVDTVQQDYIEDTKVKH